MPKYAQRPMQNNSRQYCQKSFMSHTEFSFNKETIEKRKGAQATNVFLYLLFDKRCSFVLS